jgi:hypothetical protein
VAGMEDIYHVEIRRDREGIWATVQGPGLPRNGDTRASANLWEVAEDITLAIQNANPAFAAPYRLIPSRRRQAHWWQWRHHRGAQWTT